MVVQNCSVANFVQKVMKIDTVLNFHQTDSSYWSEFDHILANFSVTWKINIKTVLTKHQITSLLSHNMQLKSCDSKVDNSMLIYRVIAFETCRTILSNSSLNNMSEKQRNSNLFQCDFSETFLTTRIEKQHNCIAKTP